MPKSFRTTGRSDLFMNNDDTPSHSSLIPWKLYLTVTAESLLTFYLATFCMVMFFTHRGTDWIPLAILLGILYAFVIFVCAKRIIQLLPLPALMLIVPIAPLLALIIVLSLIPVLQKL